MKRLILLATILFLGLDRVPEGRIVKVKVEQQEDRLSIVNQDGLGVLFYRGMDEVSEWLAATPAAPWEADLQRVVKDGLGGELMPAPLRRFRLVDPRAEALAIDIWSRNQNFRFGYTGSSTTATLALDSVFVYETSGDGAIWYFNSPVTQSSAALTVYVYCTAATGSATSSSVVIYDSQTDTAGDPQRPPAGASPLATSGNVDASSCGTAKWLTYSIASVSLTAGSWYFVIAKNDTATPGSNHFTVMTRGPLFSQVGTPSGTGITGPGIRASTTTDGITTDPSQATSNTQQAAAVIKFGDGTIIGSPWVATSASASNDEYRGTRFTFDEDVIVSGVTVANTVTATIATTLEIYNGASQLRTVTLDVFSKGNGISANFAAITFTGGTAIDVVLKPASSATVGTYATIGTSPPADVQTAAGPVTYVNGATPGSFTNTSNRMIPITLTIDTNPAISGGGGTSCIGC